MDFNNLNIENKESIITRLSKSKLKKKEAFWFKSQQ